MSVRPPRWPAAAWLSIAFVIAFIAASCWWLSQNRGIPVYDAGVHLSFAIDTYEAISSGRILDALTLSVPYPPLTHLVGAVGIFVGGVTVATPTIAANLVFVPLLALGCYQVARRAFRAQTGLLAVAFALGSPLIIEEFHEFMLDAPEAAMVAVALWAILATERFSRVSTSALAGVAVGLGLLSKETFAFFVAGVVLVALVRGGRRAWLGFAVFAAVALAIALPWYAYELSTVHALAGEAFGSASSEPYSIAPPRLSHANLEWYLWSFVNQELYLPLFALAAVGWLWTLAGFVRRRWVSPLAPELAVGAFVAWVALTETYVHDPRYGIPLIVYLAVFGVAWISRLPRVARAAMSAAVIAIALANTLGVGFGVGRTLASGQFTDSYQMPGRVTLYSINGMWLGAPIQQGDVLGVLRGLRRQGVREVGWFSSRENELEFSGPGLVALAQIAGLRFNGGSVNPLEAGSRFALLRHGLPQAGLPRPCTRLQSGLDIWVQRGGSGAGAWSACPLRAG